MRIFVTLVLLVSLTSAPSAQVEQRSRRIDPINVLSQGILAGALTRIDQGSPAGMDPRPTIHHNFPQLIEQNFVRMTPAAMARFLDSMSMREIADLAQLYTTATADNGRQPRLLDVMALRLDGTRLGRVSEHFGFGPVYAAIWRVAPEKSMMFQQTARTSAAAPTPGAMLASLPSSAAQIKGAIQITAGPNFLDMTIPEIYFTYRSAAMGSLSSAAAAWEASVLVGLRFSGALGYGYTAGTIINYAF